MPYEITTFQLPCGARGGRIEWSGTISAEESVEVIKQLSPGGTLHGLPTLVVTQKASTMTPEARALFGNHNYAQWMAGVDTNTVMRVTANFIIRVKRTKWLRLFADEQEAVRWLDERAREDARAGA